MKFLSLFDVRTPRESLLWLTARDNERVNQTAVANSWYTHKSKSTYKNKKRSFCSLDFSSLNRT